MPQFIFFNNNGKNLFQISADRIYVEDNFIHLRKDSKAALADMNGRIILDYFYDEIEMIGNGTSKARRLVKKDGKFGYLDAKGERVIDLIYNQAEGFQEGLALVKDNKGYKFINEIGKDVFYVSAKKVYGFNHGRALIQEDKYGFVDTNANNITGFVFDHAYSFSNPHRTLAKKGTKWGVIDRDGELICDFILEVDELSYLSRTSSLLKLKSNKLWGFVHESGEIVTPCKYTEIGRMVNDLIEVKAGKLYGVINVKGEEVIPCEYEQVRIVAEDFIALKKNKKWGLSNGLGELCIEHLYDAIYYCEGSVVVKNKKKWQIYTLDGKLGVDLNYDSVFDFNHGIARVQKGDLFGYIDKYGTEIIPCIYTETGDAGFLPKGIGENRLAVKLGDKWGVVDFNNNPILEIIFNSIVITTDRSNEKNLLLEFMQEGKWGIASNDGHILIPAISDDRLDIEKNMFIASVQTPEALEIDFYITSKDGEDIETLGVVVAKTNYLGHNYCVAIGYGGGGVYEEFSCKYAFIDPLTKRQPNGYLSYCISAQEWNRAFESEDSNDISPQDRNISEIDMMVFKEVETYISQRLISYSDDSETPSIRAENIAKLKNGKFFSTGFNSWGLEVICNHWGIKYSFK